MKCFLFSRYRGEGPGRSPGPGLWLSRLLIQAPFLPVRIADPFVVVPHHLAFIGAVRAVAVRARVVGPVDDAAEIADEAAQHLFGRGVVVLAEFNELVGQRDSDLVFHVLFSVLFCAALPVSAAGAVSRARREHRASLDRASRANL